MHPVPPSLQGLGFDPSFEALAAPHLADGNTVGRVTRSDRGLLTVQTADGQVRAAFTGRIRRAVAADPVSAPTVGDWVVLREGVVIAVLPRRSALVREDPDETTIGQVLAANVDLVLITTPMTAPPNLRRIERTLALVWQSGARAAIVATKSDLAEDLEGEIAAIETVALGVPVLPVSVVSGYGLPAVAELATPGTTIALLGPSGAGKSTLVNALAGEDRLATGAIRSDGRGRHVTTHRELVVLPGGGLLIDTPGLRTLALWDSDEGLDAAFEDIQTLAASCRFGDCSHSEEPGCAVVAAADAGTLDSARLEGWRKLRKEQRWLASRRDARLRAEDKAHWKQIHKAQRTKGHR